MLKSHHITVRDTHNNYYLDGLAPDISTLCNGYALDAHVVNSVGDIKPRKSETYAFRDQNKGQVLNYGLKIRKNEMK